MKYESAILKRLIDTYGVVGNPRYISEIIKEFIIQGKECFPNLFTYQSDWLAHIDEFGLSPSYTVSYTGQSIYAPNTLERPVKRAILTGQTLVNLLNDYNNGQYRSSLVGETDFITLLNMNDKKVYFDTANEDGSYKKSIVINPYSVYTKQFSPTDKFRLINLTEAHGWTSENYTECRIVMLKGDYTNVDIPYFTGMQSVKMPGLTTTGKNLFDINKCISGKSIDDNGELIDGRSHQYATEEFIKIDNTITISIISEDDGVPDTANGTRLRFYDKNKKLISSNWFAGGVQTQGNRKKRTFTVNGAEYLRLNFSASGGGADTSYEAMKTIQIENGSLMTSYEPYKSNILTVNEDVTLRSNGGICDELNLLTGQLTQRIGEEGEVLSQEVVKTVELTILDQNRQNVKQLMAFNGGTHFNTGSLEGSLLPTISVSVETDLEETLKVCSLEGNTM